MKSLIFPLLVAVVLTTVSLHSQSASAPEDQLLEAKAANVQLIERQKKTIEKLAEMKATAEQLKIFTKRG